MKCSKWYRIPSHGLASKPWCSLSLELLRWGLPASGLYGLIAFSVAQRSREIGIRMALGASKAGILRMILGDGFQLTTVGLLLGFTGVVSTTRFVHALLFEIDPLDPATLASVICILLIVSLLACYFPARRAAKADPATLLHEE